MERNASGNHIDRLPNSQPPVIRILDNSKRKRKRTRFLKYRSLSDYYQDYYSSEDEEIDIDPDSMNEPTTTNSNVEKLDLTAMVSKIASLDDVLKLCEMPLDRFKPCNRGDLIRLKKIQSPLADLNKMIGMPKLKKQIIYHALYYCQDLHKVKPPPGVEDEGDLMHTVIEGSPGTGKTSVAKILGKIYLKLGVLKSDKFVIAKRKDLIAEYLGQTTIKTTKVLDSALGGVLFIDEAYSLGNEEKRDIYSKECIDAINQYLTEHKKDLVVIIAGYKDSLKTCFFANNEGLERRFPWVYSIDEYNHEDLRNILIKQVKDSGWGFLNDEAKAIIPPSFIKDNLDYFNHAGGSTEVFLNKCKLAHSKNTFGLPSEKKGKLTHSDILLGLEMHKENVNGHKTKENPPPDHMYT